MTMTTTDSEVPRVKLETYVGPGLQPILLAGDPRVYVTEPAHTAVGRSADVTVWLDGVAGGRARQVLAGTTPPAVAGKAGQQREMLLVTYSPTGWWGTGRGWAR